MEGLGLVLGARRLEVRGLRAPIVGIGAIGAGSFVESGGGVFLPNAEPLKRDKYNCLLIVFGGYT